MTKKIGYLSGIIAFLISLISKIPINPSENLEINFRLFVIDNTEYYIWGSLENGIISFSSMVSQFPENLIAIFIWCLVIFIGISSIIASNSNTKYNSSFKLYILNILFSAFLLIINSVIIFILLDWNDFISIFSIIGMGYYLILIILVINIISLHFLKKNEKY